MMAKKTAKATRKKPQVPFVRKLVLNQWVLSLFDVQHFEELAEDLRDETLEGLDENNIHHFYHVLTAYHFSLTQLPADLLLEYRNGPRELDSAVSEIFLGFQAAKSR